jgi:hypothetical protein
MPTAKSASMEDAATRAPLVRVDGERVDGERVDRERVDRELIDREFGTGWQKWNLQAWFDFVMIRLMMSRVGDLIPKTYVPILRLVAEDAGKVDDAYEQVLALREPIHLFDSPRDKWRILYGSYIRELEWVFGELRQHFPTKEYQELVTDIMSRAIRDAMSAFLPSLEKMTRERDSSVASSRSAKRSHGAAVKVIGKGVEKLFGGRIGNWIFEHMNPMSPIVGPVDLEILPQGEIKLFIPRCWMHTAPGTGKTQDQACVQACKGACERVFNGRTPISMEFEPHLPDFSCTLRVQLEREAMPSRS